jgi:hypothetical protein
VGGKHHDLASRHLFEIVNKPHPPVHKPAHHVLVVDDLVVDVDLLAGEQVQHLVHDVDGHADAGAKTAGVGEDQLHRSVVVGGIRPVSESYASAAAPLSRAGRLVRAPFSFREPASVG